MQVKQDVTVPEQVSQLLVQRSQILVTEFLIEPDGHVVAQVVVKA